MNNLSSINTMRNLEYQRSLLQLKAAEQERQVRQDIDSIKADYAPIVNGVNSIRNGFAKLRLITPILFPVIRFFWNRRKKRQQ